MGARLALACVAAAAVLAGCGGGDDGPPDFTEQQVSETFERLTGDGLVSDPAGDNPNWSILSRPRQGASSSLDYSRYGVFSVYILKKDDAAEFVYKKDRERREVKPDRQGIYWSQSGKSWQAARPFRNAVLTWQAGEQKRTDERWNRLVAVMAAIGKPAAAVKLPPGETPCQKQGIDPARGKEGTCKLGSQTATIVNRDTPLKLPGLTVRVSKVENETQFKRSYAGPVRPKGEFVVVRYRVTNNGNEPLSYLTPELVVGTNTYARDAEAEIYADGLDRDPPFPIQPDETSSVTTVFDIPREAASRAEREGAIVFPADEGGSGAVEDASRVGRVRLGD